MKKKIPIFFLLMLLSLIFCSCSNTLNKKKPNDFYYTNELAKYLTIENSFSAYVLDTNFHRQKKLSNEHILNVKDFIKLLNKNNFIKKPENLPSKPIYKMYFTFNDFKYVVNVYNDRYIAIYPWDGIYEMDYIDMNGIYISNNLFKLCKHIIPRY